LVWGGFKTRPKPVKEKSFFFGWKGTQHAIWTATIENGLVADWRIYEDSEENKLKLWLMLPDDVDKTRKGSG
jgi:hypothetical protein